MNIHFVLDSPWSEVAVGAFVVAGYVLGRYHGRDKTLRDQHNATVPRYGETRPPLPPSHG